MSKTHGPLSHRGRGREKENHAQVFFCFRLGGTSHSPQPAITWLCAALRDLEGTLPTAGKGMRADD